MVFLQSCQTNPAQIETALPTGIPEPVTTPRPAGSGGVAEEIQLNTETGSPISLQRTLEIIRSRNLASTEFGRAMVNVSVTLLNTLYPAIQAELLQRDPPLTHSYSRILREAERGNYITPDRSSSDFLEHVLPFLTYYPPFSRRSFPAETYISVLPDLEKAAGLNKNSVLAVFFMGFAYENTGRLENALSLYSQAWESFPDCYPAALGIARIMETQGQQQELVQFLYELSIRFPDNIAVKRQMAIAFYNSGEWNRAGVLADEILRQNSRDRDFLLMRAHIFVEQGALLQARAPLDIYATINPTNPLYLFLRARIQHEVYHNRDSALVNLRTILRNLTPADTIYNKAAVYAAQLLIESSRPQEQAEGRNLLRQLLSVPDPSLEAVSLALRDAVRLEDWAEARIHLTRLLRERRSPEDLLMAYTVENAQGNNAAALSYAQELYQQDRSNEEGTIAYISALITAGRREEAARIIDSQLSGMSSGALKSRYHYLRSLTRSSEEARLNDLQTSLFENPRNLNALIASFEIFHRRNDARRALHYLRQALAISPDNPRLQRYAAEYNNTTTSNGEL